MNLGESGMLTVREETAWSDGRSRRWGYGGGGVDAGACVEADEDGELTTVMRGKSMGNTYLPPLDTSDIDVDILRVDRDIRPTMRYEVKGQCEERNGFDDDTEKLIDFDAQTPSFFSIISTFIFSLSVLVVTATMPSKLPCSVDPL